MKVLDRKLFREDQIYELRYEDLVENPHEQLRDIYEQLGLGDFSRTEPAILEHLAEVKNYRPNKYDLPDEKRDAICERWGDYFDCYGYEK